MLYRLVFIAWLLMGPFFSIPAWAYVGPGVGITMLGTFWVALSFVGMLLAGIVVWPIRSFFRRRKNKDKQSETSQSS